MKLEPMKPAPPVTRSFTRSSSSRDLPDVAARVVPRQPAFVRRRGLRREVQVREVDDPARGRPEVASTVGDSWRDADETRRAAAEHQPPTYAFGAGALSHVDQ